MRSLYFFSIIALIVLFTPDSVSASNSIIKKGEVKGVVKQEDTGVVMEYTNVALYSAIDSSLVSGTITDSNGVFILEGLAAGEYFLEVNFLGFKKRVISDIIINKEERKKSLGVISLTPATELLNDIKVVGEKTHMVYKIDKKVINVGKDLSSAGGTAVQVLENAPSVQVDAEGNVQLRGSSDFTVLINGKPSLLKGNDALKQLPASGIDKVELITNPSAKYDPDGKTGIINVIMKKNSLDGFNGLLNVTGRSNDSYQGNGNINYRKGKVNLFAGVDYSDNLFKSSLDFNRRFYNGNNISRQIISTGEMRNMQDALVYKGGIDIYFNENNDMTISASLGERGFDNSGKSSYYDYNVDDDVKAFRTSSKYMDIYGKVSGLFASLNHKFGEGHSVMISGQYESWDGYDIEDLEEAVTDEGYNSIINYGEKHSYKKDDCNYQLRFKIDYQRKLGDNAKLELGYQFRKNIREEKFNYNNYIDGKFVPDMDLRNDLNYDRYIHSVYTTYGNSFYGFKYQLGVRGEFLDRSIVISNKADKYMYDVFDLFPSVHVSRQLNSQQQLQFSYSRRVRRPDSWILNNNPRWMDPNNVFYGSPSLLAEYADSYEMGYRKMFKKLSVNAQLYYRNTDNAFAVKRYVADSENLIVHHKQTNASRTEAMGLELSANLNLYKWCQLNLGGNIYNYDIEGEVGGVAVDNSNATWDSHFSTRFTLNKDTRIQFNGYYSAKSVDLSGKRDDFIVLNLSASKELGPLTVSLNANDFIGSMKFNYFTDTSFEKTSYMVDPQSPVIMLNLSYKFNNYRYKNRNAGGNDDFRGGGF